MESRKRKIIPMKDYDEFLTSGKKEFYELYEMKISDGMTISDFECERTLGKGAFGRVILVKRLQTNEFYAIKVLEKSQIVKANHIKHVINEKRILQSLNHPFTVYLEYAFHDNSYVYLGLPLISGGEMFVHLRNMKRFQEPLSKFYAAQVLLAFEYLHFCDLIFRDLKPENLLIDMYGNVKVTDFGFCKVVKGRTYTMCGTPEYLAPEIILSKGYGKAVDWWSYGVLLFEMTAGYPPFTARDPIKIYEKAIAGHYSVPKSFSFDLDDLIANLITKDLSRRFGNLRGGIEDIKTHKWFESINWISLFNGKIDPPFIPSVKSPDDTSNFDKYKETPLQIAKKDMFKNLFDDF